MYLLFVAAHLQSFSKFEINVHCYHNFTFFYSPSDGKCGLVNSLNSTLSLSMICSPLCWIYTDWKREDGKRKSGNFQVLKHILLSNPALIIIGFLPTHQHFFSFFHKSQDKMYLKNVHLENGYYIFRGMECYTSFCQVLPFFVNCETYITCGGASSGVEVCIAGTLIQVEIDDDGSTTQHNKWFQKLLEHLSTSFFSFSFFFIQSQSKLPELSWKVIKQENMWVCVFGEGTLFKHRKKLLNTLIQFH